ncbi:biotin transporter BioY [Anaerosalibacter massiliensis]|uniref:Biotin transporter n=1 Tax=Anaerosalibacter massiliensis TaxID=1347392 RepID=A0A9X2MH87_9FIRM|nr:biotin transporter BioY [Anaerosalibacter massiliensis]MCR2043644.1 biotin transporter BioY [Anaerosalibacter massiliensis]
MKISTRDMVLVSLFTALTAIGAFLSIPIGNVPISLQSLFTILSGLILGAKLGSLSQLIYVILGLAGVKIFVGFSGGPQSIFSPSFGFLIGFIFASYVVGLITHNNGDFTFKKIFLATLVGTLVIYTFGVPYMYVILNKILLKKISFITALKTGCIIFLPGDILKCFISSYVATKIIPLTIKETQIR